MTTPYGCITRLSPKDRSRNAARIAAVPLPTNECTGDEDGSWYALRTMQCQIDPNVKFTYRDDKGKVLGTALFATAQQMDLSTTSLQWSETDQIVLTQTTGQLPPLTISWTATCTPTCNPGTTTMWNNQPVTLGNRLEKTYKITDKPPTTPATKYDYLDMTYTLDIRAANSIPITPPITWDSELRCDANLSITNTSGCVVHWFTPTLFIYRAAYGSSADMIDWAQKNLSDHWGLKGKGQPLHRLQKKSQADSNRQAICGATKFTKDPTITDDSCDEFPFAGTYESGALNGVDHGRDCAQVTAVKKGSGTDLPTVWPTVAVIGTPSGNEKCVRGHIPGPLNSDLGGAYGNFVISARLADDDAFWLRVAS
ncbi:hypothetical protein ACFVDN_07660 [Streptomyces californicus]|uniref:hypothetical protein n=1 Tax=Streptomyces californicus TaxID=67351 RepID=UPI0036B0887A